MDTQKMEYQKPEIVAQNGQPGSYAASCLQPSSQVGSCCEMTY